MGLEEKHRGLHVAILGGAQKFCCSASKGGLGPSLLQCLDTSGKPLTHHKMMSTVRLGWLGNLGINRGFVLFILGFHSRQAERSSAVESVSEITGLKQVRGNITDHP